MACEVIIPDTSDDDRAPRLSRSVLDKLGTIQVDVFRCIKTGINPDYVPCVPENPDGHGTIHEKSKKAGTHCVK